MPHVQSLCTGAPEISHVSIRIRTALGASQIYCKLGDICMVVLGDQSFNNIFSTGGRTPKPVAKWAQDGPDPVAVLIWLQALPLALGAVAGYSASRTSVLGNIKVWVWRITFFRRRHHVLGKAAQCHATRQQEQTLVLSVNFPRTQLSFVA